MAASSEPLERLWVSSEERAAERDAGAGDEASSGSERVLRASWSALGPPAPAPGAPPRAPGGGNILRKILGLGELDNHRVIYGTVGEGSTGGAHRRGAARRARWEADTIPPRTVGGGVTSHGVVGARYRGQPGTLVASPRHFISPL